MDRWMDGWMDEWMGENDGLQGWRRKILCESV